MTAANQCSQKGPSPARRVAARARRLLHGLPLSPSSPPLPSFLPIRIDEARAIDSFLGDCRTAMDPTSRKSGRAICLSTSAFSTECRSPVSPLSFFSSLLSRPEGKVVRGRELHSLGKGQGTGGHSAPGRAHLSSPIFFSLLPLPPPLPLFLCRRRTGCEGRHPRNRRRRSVIRGRTGCRPCPRATSCGLPSPLFLFFTSLRE